MEKQRHYFNRVLLAICLVSLAGCGSSESVSQLPEEPVSELPEEPVQPGPPTNKLPEPQQNLKALKAAAEKYSKDTMAWMEQEGIDCTLEPVASRHELCEQVRVNFTDGQFESQRVDEDQTILVLDREIALQVALRYRSRMKAAYAYDAESNKFVADNPNLLLSKVGVKILSELDKFTFTDAESGESFPGFASSFWLGELGNQYAQRVPQDEFNSETNSHQNAHGNRVIGYMAEYTPRAGFVVIDIRKFRPFEANHELVCQKDSNALLAKFQAAADSLKQDVLQKHGVRFVNYSGSHTADMVSGVFNKHCDGLLTIEEASSMLLSLQPFYEVMFNLEDILGLQSALHEADPLSHALDIIEFDNRLRIASFTTGVQDSQLDKTGEQFWRETASEYADEFNMHETVDMFINTGAETFPKLGANSTPKMHFDAFGLRYAPDYEKHTSWIAPAATVYALYLQSLQLQVDENWAFSPAQLKSIMVPKTCFSNEDDTDFIKGFARQGGDCRLQDPVKFKASELQRTGYLNIE
ncbi:hypothetical protein L1077_05165 [Pseudoalteromonas luteoviolacea]|uniref:hypothetical protein n=1 Tax=Pseudoalteromonas luteoviolacea TaxID=43657 RepID=UPI001F30AD91|nr:hypothetical protein [Pseudoalteromonas luteoviolacea]MCF6438819.1 hypothetical protein [Pseudoalteromonas luteoviolacea]